MSVDTAEATNAVRALAYRLRTWGVTEEPDAKARGFIADLTRRGWKPSFELTARRPPRKAEECRTHPGEYAASCRCCAADKRAVTDELVDTEATRRSAQEAIRAARDEVRKATTAPEEN